MNNTTPGKEIVDAEEKFVVKRNGEKAPMIPIKIKERLESISKNMDTQHINFDVIVSKVMDGSHTGITTAQLDNLAAETCAYMTMAHPSYSFLAANISVSNLHKETNDDFLAVITKLRFYKDS
jgi:ribonucleoside-diphosphate reductase subunit M1